MSRATQRKQQKRKQKQWKDRQRRRSSSASKPHLNARHRDRLSRQKPRAWNGERPEDVAVFDDRVFASLPKDMASHVRAVREALDMAGQLYVDEAVARVANIPRSSLLSDWRLLVRGLASWLNRETEAASACWARLDPARRPGRIAGALMAAHRTDLETIPLPSNESPHQGHSGDLHVDWGQRLDKQTLFAAKLVRKVRIDRAAIRVAEAGTAKREGPRDLLVGPDKLKWLVKFSADYRPTEPKLVAALHQAALARAFAQPYVDVFATATKSLPGPPHDPNNSLLSFFYHSARDSSTTDRFLKNYLLNDLPHNKSLSEPLRNALISQVHLNEARQNIESAGTGFASMFAPRPDKGEIEASLRRSINSYPANRSAHKARVDWIESQLEQVDGGKRERQRWETRLLEAMTAWSHGLPDDTEPRLWLVDHYIENESLEEAKPHVDWLSASRHDEPKVRCMPWKWKLLEAMQLSRRKATLSDVTDRLDAADELWPAWLPKDWLAYLRAALLLRRGDTEEYEQSRQAICREREIVRDSLADSCMMLGAAQRMRVTAADLKPLREPVDGAVKNLKTLADDELMEVGTFYWDLHRVELHYPAYRSHGSKFGKEFFSRIKERPRMIQQLVGDERFVATILWSSDHRFWGSGYDFPVPVELKVAAKHHPKIAAALVNGCLKLRYGWSIKREHGVEKEFIRQQAASQRDPFYRSWFASLADEMDESLEERGGGEFANSFAGFGDMFSSFMNEFRDQFDDIDDDDDGALDCDPTCPCPKCQAARERSGSTHRRIDTPF